MPRPSLRIAIVLFWMVMTGWLVKDEVLPRMGFGDLNYRGVLSQRAIPQKTLWKIELNGKSIGQATTIVTPGSDGSFVIESQFKIDIKKVLNLNFSRLLDISTDPLEKQNRGSTKKGIPSVKIDVVSEFFIDPLGKLETLSIELAFEGSLTRIDILGRVEGEMLVLRTTGLGALGGLLENMRLQIDPEAIFTDKLVPIDQIPNLRIGKTWTTRSINPFVTLSGPLRFLFRGESIEVSKNEVVTTESIEYHDEQALCYLIEHKRDEIVGRTWVSVTDGMVLKRETLFGGASLTFILDSRQRL